MPPHLGHRNAWLVRHDGAAIVAVRSTTRDAGAQPAHQARCHRAAGGRRPRREEPAPQGAPAWGWYDSIDARPRFQVKRIMVKPGASLSLQMHHHRAEHWIVVQGTAEVTCGDTKLRS